MEEEKEKDGGREGGIEYGTKERGGGRKKKKREKERMD